tara:strand:- start:2380 stop:3015 length:636 start_codon:yes stop_codon:yes gene_type:complete
MRKVLKKYIDSPVTIENGNLISRIPVNVDGTQYVQSLIMPKNEEVLTNYIADTIVKKNNSVLNIGYGLGFFDKRVQQIGVSSHTIIECHPDVIELCDLDNVTLIENTWQNAIPTLTNEGKTYDCIWFDTYRFEGNNCFQEEWLAFLSVAESLLNDNGIISLFTLGLTEANLNKLITTGDAIKSFERKNKLYQFESITSNDYNLIYWVKNKI